MSEMVERVARVIAQHAIDDGSPCCLYCKDVCRVIARAAISAMREPTEAMTDAMDNSDSLLWSLEEGEGLDGVHWEGAWQAAIDEALK